MILLSLENKNFNLIDAISWVQTSFTAVYSWISVQLVEYSSSLNITTYYVWMTSFQRCTAQKVVLSSETNVNIIYSFLIIQKQIVTFPHSIMDLMYYQ